MSKTAVATMSVAELEALLAQKREAAQADVAKIASPYIEHVLTTSPVRESKNGKPWVGTTGNVKVVIDGREYRASLTITDVKASEDLKVKLAGK